MSPPNDSTENLMVQDYIFCKESLNKCMKNIPEMPTNLSERSGYKAHRKKQGQTLCTADSERKKETCINYISVWENPFRTLRGEEKEHEAAVCIISGQSGLIDTD